MHLLRSFWLTALTVRECVNYLYLFKKIKIKIHIAHYFFNLIKRAFLFD